MIQEQQKNGTAWFSVELIFEWCEDAMVFRAFVFIFLFRRNGKTNTWLRTILVTVMVIISKMPLWKLIDISCFQSSRQLRGTLTTAFERTLQLEILRALIKMPINFSLDKYDKTKMGDGVLQVISCTKMSVGSKSIAPRHFTCCCIHLFLLNKPSFSIQPSVDRIILFKTCFPFYLLILCVSWSSSSASKLFL